MNKLAFKLTIAAFIFQIALCVLAKTPYKIQAIKVFSKVIEPPKKLLPELQKYITAEDLQFPDGRTQFFAHEIALGGDKIPELEITASVPTSNSPIWFYAKQGNKYTLLLRAYVGVFGYRVLKPVSCGYHDIMTIEHCSAVEHQITVYRFNGQRYKQLTTFSEIENADK